MTPADAVTRYGLVRPGMGDALVAVHRAHGPAAAAVWARLLTAAGLAGDETDDTAVSRMLDAMLAADPLTRICARSLRTRLTTYACLADTPTLTAAPSPVGSPVR